MKIVTCAGYYGTGSSAVTDLMREYSSVSCKTDFEIAIIYHYRGINNLYYHLIKDPVRDISNNAIKEFEDLCDYLSKSGRMMNYSIYFEGTLEEARDKYLEKICGASYKYYFAEDIYQLSPILKIFDKVIKKIYQMLTHDNYKMVGLTRARDYYLHTIDEKYFFECTKEFLEDLFAKINTKEYLMIDQLVPSSSIDLCTNYFDDLKVILVDRDPRDIYLSEKYIWHGSVAPTDDIKIFCEWYRWNRSLPGSKGENILRVQFEDMIFRYEDTLNLIERFIGLKGIDHVKKFKYFVPEISKDNCKLWQKFKDEGKNIAYIERELKQYLYEE